MCGDWGVDVSTGFVKTDSCNLGLTRLGVMFDEWWDSGQAKTFVPDDINAYFKNKNKIRIECKSKGNFDVVTFERTKGMSTYEELLVFSDSECTATGLKRWVKRLLMYFHQYTGETL